MNETDSMSNLEVNTEYKSYEIEQNEKVIEMCQEEIFSLQVKIGVLQLEMAPYQKTLTLARRAIGRLKGKICPLCGMPDTIVSFNKCKSRKDGFQVYCKSCFKNRYLAKKHKAMGK